MFIDLREREEGREREREREKYPHERETSISYLPYVLDQELNWQTESVP